MNLKKLFLNHCKKNNLEVNPNQIDLIKELNQFYIRNFDKYISFHFEFDESISGWFDLSSKQKLVMFLKILADCFGFLMIIVIISEIIN